MSLNSDIRDFNRASIIVRKVKYKRLGSVGHVYSVGEARNPYKILVGNTVEKRTFEKL